jgi:hypothetical protein
LRGGSATFQNIRRWRAVWKRSPTAASGLVAQRCSVCVKAKFVRKVPNVISSVLVHGEVRDFRKGDPSEARSFAQYKLVEGYCFLCVEDDVVLLSLSYNVLAQPFQFMWLQIESNFLSQLSQTAFNIRFAWLSLPSEE